MTKTKSCRQRNWESLQERDGSLVLRYYHLVASVRDRARGKITHLDISHKSGTPFTVLIRVSFPHTTRKGREGGPVFIFQASSILFWCSIFPFQMQGSVLTKIKMSVRPSLVQAPEEASPCQYVSGFPQPLGQAARGLTGKRVGGWWK